MILKKCQKCNEYTLKKTHCKEKTKETGYKYIKVKIEDNNQKIVSKDLNTISK